MTSKPSNLTLKKWTLTLSKEAKESLLRQLRLPKSCLHSTNEFDKKPCPVGLDVCPTRVSCIGAGRNETWKNSIPSPASCLPECISQKAPNQVCWILGPHWMVISQITLQAVERTKHGVDTSSYSSLCRSPPTNLSWWCAQKIMSCTVSMQARTMKQCV